MNKRSFLKKLAGIAAVVALAPEIAFARNLALPVAPTLTCELLPFQDQFHMLAVNWFHVSSPNADLVIENFSGT